MGNKEKRIPSGNKTPGSAGEKLKKIDLWTPSSAGFQYNPRRCRGLNDREEDLFYEP
jgi:hypothetical protein